MQTSCNPEGGKIQPSVLTRGFKLGDHPETLAVEGLNPDDVIGEFTIGKDTRRVLYMGDPGELVFRVNIPENGKLRFAYGMSHEAFKYARELHLKGELRSGGEPVQIGQVGLNTRSTDAVGKWFEAQWDIPEGVSGKYELALTLDGQKEGASKDIFMLAHPTIVDPSATPKPRRIIWIGVDTLRADHLGCYGYERGTSPNTDAFAGDGVLFERCIATCPWTYPSFASMLVGRFPTIAGATTNVKFLSDDEVTVAEVLSKKDFATFSVVNSPWVGRMTNLQQGFDTAFEYFRLRAEKSFTLAAEWMKRHPDEDCFVFIHLMDPHLPYRPKKENLGRFAPGYTGDYSEMFDMNHDDIEMLRAGTLEMEEADRQQVEALYDEEIFGCDQDFGAFIEMLKTSGFYDDSLIIFTGDHGEEFWEHGGFEHGHQLYDEVLHVPLIIRGPGFDGGSRVEILSSTIDIFPTVLSWLDYEIPDDINGVPVSELISGRIEREARHIISEQLYYGVEQKGLSTDNYRYILHTLDDSEELYDISDDPGMYSDVSADRRSASRGFRYLLKEVTLNGMAGWHIRFSYQAGNQNGKSYNVTLTAPGGFTNIEPHGFQEDDTVKAEGDVLIVTVGLMQPGEKFLAFTTIDESVEVGFDIIVDGEDDDFGLVRLGPDKELYPGNHFVLQITDKRFGLGIPNFRQGKDHGIYIWGNSEGLREELTPEIDDAVREELRSLGYLQ